MFYSEGELTVESPGGLEQEKSRCKVVTGSSYGKMERQEVCVAAGGVRRPSGGRQGAVRRRLQSPESQTVHFLNPSSSPFLCLLLDLRILFLCPPLCPTLPYICALFPFQFPSVSRRSVLLSFSSFSFRLCSVCSLSLKSVPFLTFLFLRFILFSDSFHSTLAFPFAALTYLLTCLLACLLACLLTALSLCFVVVFISWQFSFLPLCVLFLTLFAALYLLSSEHFYLL